MVPNRERAEVPIAKVARYLLNTAHPEGGPKAVFFIARGFVPAQPERLIDALLAHVAENAYNEQLATSFGVVYSIDAPLRCPDGREPAVRSVWIIEPPVDFPRLVTAYPAPS